jgi:predicted AlkP superfamily phosphohydrolase/phosphomutase
MSVDLLVVAIDALDPELLDEWRDDLPELEAIRRKGTANKLESTVPTVTGVAWPSMMTGKLPTKHGVTHFTDEGDIIDRNAIQSKALWELLDESGSSVSVVGMPGTYPPDPISGVIISGMFTPEEVDDWVHPPELQEEISEPIFDTGKADKETLLEAVATRRKTSLELLDREDWEVFITTFLESDRGGHSLLRPKSGGSVDGYKDLKEVYIAIDDALGDIRQAADPRNVVIVSDHGFGRIPRKRINVTQWLTDQGFAEIAKDAPSTSSITKERVESLLDGTRILSFIPDQVKKLGREILPSRRIEADGSDSDQGVSYTEYWLHGGFHVPKGGPTEKLISELETLRDPETGERLFERVIRTEDTFEGPYASQMPTILVRFAPNYRGQPTVGDGLIEPIPTNVVEPDHRLYGVLLAAGPDFVSRDENWSNNFHLCDITPTLLHLFGYPVPSDCDGSVRHELFADESDAATEPVVVGPPSADNRDRDNHEDSNVRNRLEDLGYIE